MTDAYLLGDMALALALGLLGGVSARAVGLSPIIGYLFAGFVISPFTPGYIANPGVLRELAEIGIIFLMFGVGLHFNLRDLASVRRVSLPGALLKITVATAMGIGVTAAFGYGLREGLVLGLAISVASTVVLVRALAERGMLDTPHGRIAIGWLVVEDIATVIFLVLLPVLRADGDSAWSEAAWGLGRAAVFVGVLLAVGYRAIPWVLERVAAPDSRELFVLAIVAIALGIATSATLFGLSVALGAFVAGVVVSETEVSQRAAEEVLPFRDAFAVLFFVSVGMLVDPRAIAADPWLVLMVTATVVGGKFIAGLVVAAALRCSARTAFTVAAGLAQAGEFSFIVAQQGLMLELLSPVLYNAILASAVASIALNPLLFRGAAVAEAWFTSRRALAIAGRPAT